MSGTVTVEGKPLPLGIIVFTPARGTAVAAEIVDGKYTAVGVPTGEVKVSLDLTTLKKAAETAQPKASNPMLKKGGAGVDATVQKSLNPGGKAEMPEAAREYYAKQKDAAAEGRRRTQEALVLLKDIPDKYYDPNSSGWTVTVTKDGSTTFDAKVTK